MAHPAGTQIICAEVWGGYESVETTIEVPGMRGIICANPAGHHEGGDVYYTTACQAGLTARVCLVDLTGHGAAVTEVSGWFHDTLRAQIGQPDPSVILRAVNEIAVQRGLEAMATAVCFSFDRKTSTLRYAYAGHPPAYCLRRARGRWEALALETTPGRAANIVLGVTPASAYDIGITQLETGDRIFVYSDGITEIRTASGEQFSEARLHALLDAHAQDALEAVPRAVMEEMRAFAGPEAMHHDDMTLMCFEVGPAMPAPMMYYAMRNWFRRMWRDCRTRRPR